MTPDEPMLFPLEQLEPIPMFRLFELTTELGPMHVNPNSVVLVTADVERAGKAMVTVAAGGQTLRIPAEQSRAEVVRRVHRALSTGAPEPTAAG